MKISELRDLTAEELKRKELELRESLFRLRFRLTLGERDTVKQLRFDRTDLARVKTILRARAMGIERE